MPAFSYPAVFRQEIRQQRRVPQEVSTANFGLLGFTTKGPVGVPILTRDQTEYFRLYGEFTPQSVTPIIAAAYFANEGQNLVMVREVGTGALRSAGNFSQSEEDEVQGLTSDAATTALSVTLASLFDIQPGSLTLFANDRVDVTVAEVLGQTIAANTGPYSFRIPEDRFIVPGSAQVLYETSLSPTSLNDDGAGNLVGTSEVATIDYLNGIIDLTTLINPDAADVTITYQYFRATAVNNEIVGNALAGATVYHGQLANKHPYFESILFEWTSGTVAQTATVTSTGVIQDSGSQPIGTIDLITGEFTIDVGANALDAGTFLTADYAYLLFFTAVDDGAGAISGDLLTAPGTINYETGEIVATVVQTTIDAQTIFATYEAVIHPTEARDEGVFGDNLRMRITRDDNSIDTATGVYDRFVVEVLELQGQLEVVLDTFSGVKLEDITDSDHIGQVINDQFTGSGSVLMASPLTSAVPSGFNGQAKTGVLVRDPDGTTNPALVTRLPLSGGALVPGTVVVTYLGIDGNTYNLRDDAQGSFNQDPDNGDTGIDITTLATVDYITGEISIVPSNTPAASLDVTAAYTLTGPSVELVEAYTGGNDGAALTRANVTDVTLQATDRGIYAFNGFDNLLHIAIPDFAGDADAQQALLSYLTNRGDGMAILSPPENLSPQNAVDYKRFVLQLNGQQGERGAMYWPWILVEDPITTRTVAIPPHGHVAAVWSRTDRNRNVGKGPAGVNDGGLTFLRGLQFNANERDVDTIFQGGINAIWAPPRQQNLVWGVRTLDTTGGEFTYINKRRTVDFVSLSVSRSLWWTVFENIGAELFASIQNQITGLLTTFFRRGILAGDSLDEAFFVQCDTANNPIETQQQGFVFVDYGVRTQTPGEFIVLRHRQIVG